MVLKVEDYRSVAQVAQVTLHEGRHFFACEKPPQTISTTQLKNSFHRAGHVELWIKMHEEHR